MKKTLAALVIGLMVAGTSMAQQAPHQDKKSQTERHQGKHKKSNLSPEERAIRRSDKMEKELGLNASQAKQMQALHLKQLNKREAMRAQYKDADTRSREQRKAEMKENHAQYQAELKTILTQKQYAQYEEKREEMHQKRKGRHDRNDNKRPMKSNSR